MTRVDLRAWITSDLASLRRRLDRGVLALIPADRRAERVDGGGIAVTYILWHFSRHHDVAVNSVVRGVDEVVEEWIGRLGVGHDLWRGLAEGEDGDLVQLLDPLAVEDYALAVIDTTAAWVDTADLGQLEGPPAVNSDDALAGLGTPVDRFDWLYEMWRGQPASYFLSWEAIGHSVNHLGELVAIRNRMGLSPF